MDLADVVPYNIEFLFGEIISMSQATDIHEQLIAQLGTLFCNQFDDQPDYRALGNNVKICVREGEVEFDADLSVVKGASEYVVLVFVRVYSRTE